MKMPSKDKIRNLTISSRDTQDIELPSTSVKDPSVKATLKSAGPTAVTDTGTNDPPPIPWWKRCWAYTYNKEQNLYCGRSCSSWFSMVLYTIMYLIFLATYMMVFLYVSLTIIKMGEMYSIIEKPELMTYSENGIALTAAPLLENDPLISYTVGESEGYQRHVRSIDQLLDERRKFLDLSDLGPCGIVPYGYGNTPCVIIRVNKQIGWSAKPMNANSTRDIPKDLRSWLKLEEQKLWLHCDGYNSYDKEHIGRIRYYPYPPGFDPKAFPLDMRGYAPLIAIQISNFTLGLSLTVECNLWYDSRVSSVAFLLYVEQTNR